MEALNINTVLCVLNYSYNIVVYL